ncbi:acetyl esterase [Alteribacillus bidgolensis]|uniref:Acetyl esterase n=1 Tax=Alteribacillus bidgolensis TaxID=930129 RepID=A0A1G8L1G9_9BACI|nr:acetyl esterase [Alteribacillus bidgolensis]
MKENSQGYFLTAGMMTWFRNHYLNGKQDKQNPMVSPMNNKDFSGIPPTFYCHS